MSKLLLRIIILSCRWVWYRVFPVRYDHLAASQRRIAESDRAHAIAMAGFDFYMAVLPKPGPKLLTAGYIAPVIPTHQIDYYQYNQAMNLAALQQNNLSNSRQGVYLQGLGNAANQAANPYNQLGACQSYSSGLYQSLFDHPSRIIRSLLEDL